MLVSLKPSMLAQSWTSWQRWNHIQQAHDHINELIVVRNGIMVDVSGVLALFECFSLNAAGAFDEYELMSKECTFHACSDSTHAAVQWITLLMIWQYSSQAPSCGTWQKSTLRLAFGPR